MLPSQKAQFHHSMSPICNTVLFDDMRRHYPFVTCVLTQECSSEYCLFTAPMKSNIGGVT